MEVFLMISGGVIFVLVLVFSNKSNDIDATTRRTGPQHQSKPHLAPLPRPPKTRTAPTPPRASSHGSISGKCHVIDGDTIVIQRTKIRLAGIDAPELDQPWGQKSKWAMIHICKGKVITAKLNGETSHDRRVATCYCPEGKDIGAELIKQGLALDWALFSGGKYRHLEPQGVRQKMMYVRRRAQQETPLARNANTR